MRIMRRRLAAQWEEPACKGVTTLFFLNNPKSLASDYFRSRQVRFAEAKTDTTRLCTIRNTSDHALLDSARKGGGWNSVKLSSLVVIETERMACVQSSLP